MSNIAELLYSSLSGVELSIFEIADYLDINEESVLELSIKCKGKLDELGISVDPPLTKGSANQKRLVFIKDNDPASSLNNDLDRDEGINLEFKSTMFYDIQQAKHRKDTPAHKLNSQNVVHSVLKTICAFLNTEGGVLYVGITDLKETIGLAKDFEYLREEDFDKWELKLRSLIEGRFHQGKEILKHCIVNKINKDNKVVAKIEVKRRSKESFYKKESGSSYSYYVRNGNRTDEIPIERLPDHLRYREKI